MLLLLAALACTRPASEPIYTVDTADTGAELVCEEGDVQECTCLGGVSGTQECAGDGMSWEDCECEPQETGLEVVLSYSGTRTLETVRLRLWDTKIHDLGCDSLLAGLPDGNPTADWGTTAPAAYTVFQFTELPVGITTAIVAEGLGSAGELLAAGCAEEATVFQDVLLVVPIELVDWP